MIAKNIWNSTVFCCNDWQRYWMPVSFIRFPWRSSCKRLYRKQNSVWL